MGTRQVRMNLSVIVLHKKSTRKAKTKQHLIYCTESTMKVFDGHELFLLFGLRKILENFIKEKQGLGEKKVSIHDHEVGGGLDWLKNHFFFQFFY